MQLHISKDNAALSITVADWMVEYINKTLQKQDRFTLVLSGGGTPKKLNELLASDAYKKIKLGASLIQLITGMIFEGPQLAGEINLKNQQNHFL